jgi:hypothetical protein
MQDTNTKPNSLTIEAYGLLDYSLALEAAIKDGYKVDSSTNENCPTSYGGFYTATVVIPEAQALKVIEVKDEPKPRKAKEPKTAE